MTEGALFDHEAERVVLGGLLVMPSAYDSVADSLRPEHFHDERHRKAFAAVVEIESRGESVDLVTLNGELRRAGTLDQAGGAAYLAGLMDGVPRVGNLPTWAGIVREKARRRALAQLGQRLLEQAGEMVAETDELLDRHQAAILRLIEATGAKHTIALSDAVKLAMTDLDRYAATYDGVTGVPTGLPDLDRLLGGFQPGTLNIVAGRPGHGKSVFCAQVGVWAASKGRKVLAFTLEMPPRAVAQRILLSAAEVEKWDLKANKAASGISWQKVSAAYGRLSSLPLWFNGLESPTLVQIRSAAKRQQAATGLDLVIVDYIQRCSVDRKVDRWIAVGDLAKGLKSLAMSLNVPVLAAAQLNREASQRRPALSDLRECGDLEQEADVVALLHPQQAIAEHDFPEVHLLVEKHRQGQTMPIKLSFERSYARFVQMARDVA